jgi:hypothetical protein
VDSSKVRLSLIFRFHLLLERGTIFGGAQYDTVALVSLKVLGKPGSLGKSRNSSHTPLFRKTSSDTPLPL